MHLVSQITVDTPKQKGTQTTEDKVFSIFCQMILQNLVI